MELLAKLHLFSKGMHVVGFVSWFAGLFYLVRLFAYHVESTHKPEPDRAVLHAQFMLMERRLWKVITVPAMVVTLLFGGFIGVMYLRATRNDPQLAWWLYLKIGLVAGLVVYNQICGVIRQQLAEGRCRWTSPQLRQWNEVATVFLLAIVMLAVFKTMFNALWGTLALLVAGGLLALAVKLVRRRMGGARSG
jgi:putative membrane protein